MSTKQKTPGGQFDTEAAAMLKNAPKPDAEAAVIKEAATEDEAPKRGRGRPKGSGTKARATKKKAALISAEEFEATAKAFNTIVFSLACVVTGTGDAWPEDERAATLDKAAARYAELRNISVPPEIILLSAYSLYMKDTLTKPTVKESIARRFGALKRFRVIGFFGRWFARKNEAENKIRTIRENGETKKKGWGIK